MSVLLSFIALLSFAAAAPQAVKTSSSFLPLSSSLTNPVNLSSIYVDQIQAQKPIIDIAQGLNISINPDIILNSTSPTHPVSFIAQASCNGPQPGSPSTFWREQAAHNGIAATLSGSFTVWRNVVSDFGADNSGSSDASGAINNAISSGSRKGNGFTTRPAYVYVPGGTYKISNSVNMLVNTFLVGDPLNMPTFVADSSLGTNPVIQGFDSTQQSTTNFYTGIRNIKIQTTSISTGTKAVGLNWAVSQACSLFNVVFSMPDYSSHIGITMTAVVNGNNEGGGSGTLISDCSFIGGAIGIQLSNQQYNLKGLSFNGCSTGIYVDHVFVGTFQGLTFQNCNYGVDMSNSYNVGAVSLIDSSISSCNAGVYTAVTGNGEGSLVIDNFNVGSGVTAVKSSKDGSALLSGSVAAGSTWVMGNENPQNFQSGKMYQINRPAALLSGDKYYTKQQPQYENYDVSQFVNVKSASGYTVYGDNQHDDSDAINALLAANANCKITYFPQGIYKVAKTIYVPPGSRIVGDVLSVISGIGSNFYNPNNPQPIVQVGRPGDVGVAEFTDMLFSVADVLQGATILEVNMAASSPGSVSFHNTHVRVGGTADTKVNTNCAPADTSDCKAAHTMLHITSSSSPYIENMWGWTADHSLDGGPNQNIATGRGALIESTKGAWLVGTAFEHNTLYQYNLNNAQNVYIGMQQTETAYWQGIGSPEQAPSPWASNTSIGDPTFSNCASSGDSGNSQCYMGFHQQISSSSNLVIHGSAFWVFFNDMTDGSYSNAGCPNHNNICQENAVIMTDTTSLFWYNLLTKSTTNMVRDNGVVTAMQVNNPGGWEGSVPGVIAAYLKDSGIANEQ
ncbi:related to exo-beta-1,3-glucanase [Phialocephala subalpina]|uniref:Related to exo-beta-1,3-glucanase n=1 Tax=Phialocephala subalpina TaxID=576137 RepID=A0A1L7WGU1_9HELO|nr:related to exo-beta-1,3-glucanase [Phialocephala subalpina]